MGRRSAEQLLRHLLKAIPKLRLAGLQLLFVFRGHLGFLGHVGAEVALQIEAELLALRQVSQADDRAVCLPGLRRGATSMLIFSTSSEYCLSWPSSSSAISWMLASRAAVASRQRSSFVISLSSFFLTCLILL
eukprot:3921332-Pyramimonas_sp.AAC.1